jgi:hypothetical protein
MDQEMIHSVRHYCDAVLKNSKDLKTSVYCTTASVPLHLHAFALWPVACCCDRSGGLLLKF